ncbi:ATP-binding protein [Spongiactinospora rosea]|uniref:ATP-binding protein n=1 Tax=Spongiactinospora rosea TaxID=2248750 RepID=UPI001313FBB1|nr:ATP-binding protein [Spongiactinospora rosea]
MDIRSCELEGVMQAPGLAREFVAKVLPDHPRLDDLRLLVCELVTNSVLHSRSGLPPEGGLTVIVARAASYVRIAVVDEGTAGEGGPRVREAAEDAESGRGLTLVAALADTWGHRRMSRCRTVWVQVNDDAPGGERSEPVRPPAGDHLVPARIPWYPVERGVHG